MYICHTTCCSLHLCPHSQYICTTLLQRTHYILVACDVCNFFVYYYSPWTHLDFTLFIWHLFCIYSTLHWLIFAYFHLLCFYFILCSSIFTNFIYFKFTHMQPPPCIYLHFSIYLPAFTLQNTWKHFKKTSCHWWRLLHIFEEIHIHLKTFAYTTKYIWQLSLHFTCTSHTLLHACHILASIQHLYSNTGSAFGPATTISLLAGDNLTLWCWTVTNEIVCENDLFIFTSYSIHIDHWDCSVWSAMYSCSLAECFTALIHLLQCCAECPRSSSHVLCCDVCHYCTCQYQSLAYLS